jgi:hypothetical protein
MREFILPPDRRTLRGFVAHRRDWGSRIGRIGAGGSMPRSGMEMTCTPTTPSETGSRTGTTAFPAEPPMTATGGPILSRRRALGLLVPATCQTSQFVPASSSCRR